MTDKSILYLNSRKEPLFGSIILSIAAFTFVMPFYVLVSRPFDIEALIPIIICFATAFFLFWTYFGTFYAIRDHYIIHRCGPFKGSININSIRVIQANKTMWTGFRPATAPNGLIIKYNKYDEIYISPQSNQTFIAAVRAIKPEVLVEQNL